MKRLIVGLFIAALALSLCGCFLDPAENLYAVPEQPESFYDLQSEIQALIADGASYCPPTEGENQQAVQLTNLDADAEDEAIVYLKFGGDTPLSVCVFDIQEERYTLVGKVDGAGYAFDSALYLSIDEAAGNEIVVGRKISEGVPQVLSVYTLCADGLVELMSTNYAEFITADLDSDGKRELVAFHADGDAQNGVAEYYRWVDGEIVRARETNLSAPVSSIKRIITGKMCANVPAVFVGSTYGENMIVTDIFALRDGTFTNMALSEEAGTGVATVREYYVYSCDIDADGLIELPRLIALQPLEGDTNSENQALICWFNLLTDGTTKEKCLTYHNYSAGWYLQIPQDWADGLAVTRIANAAGSQIYSFVDTKTGKERFAITAFSGDNAVRSMTEQGWEQLVQKGETIYACRYDESAGLTQQRLRELFRFIQVDWNTGET